MSTPQPITAPSPLASAGGRPAQRPWWSAPRRWLLPLASLRLTVVLFALSTFLVLVGTLAQVDKNMLEVLRDYFRCWVAWVDFQVFFPASFFRSAPRVPGGFWMPGGYSLGLALAVNLLAAHLARFQVQAKGPRLYAGWGVVALGSLLTLLIILGGHSREGLQGLPLISWDALWSILRLSLVALWVGTLVLLMGLDRQRWEFWAGAGLSACLGGLACYLLLRGDAARLSDSSLRILWQLIQGGLAGVILLMGCVMVFKKRGGIVLIHAGVALMMFGEALVGWQAVEEQVILREGQSTTFARETGEIELAVIDRSPADHDRVHAIPESRLRAGQRISVAELPFEIEILEVMQNSALRIAGQDDVNLATAGAGRTVVAEPRRSAGGAEAGGTIDVSAAYVRIIPKGQPEAAETRLLSQQFGEADILLDAAQITAAPNDPFSSLVSYLYRQHYGAEVVLAEALKYPLPESVAAGGKQFDLLLRYRRNYKPYELTLNDIRKDDYLGTSTPKDYSSWISLHDPSRDFSREKIRIWMNNPLRYAGETFYQSGYNRQFDGTEVSTLQVVTNQGWMIPYVACMLVATGMLYHFLNSLLRFLRRRLARQAADAALPTAAAADRAGWWGWAAPAALFVLATAIVLWAAYPRARLHDGLRLDRFAEIPVVSQGRIKPIDTLARTSLRAVSDKQRLTAAQPGAGRATQRQPAVKWLLDLISHASAAEDHRVFRIESLDVQATLDLERRKGFLYSVAELREGIEAFSKEVQAARATARSDAAQLTNYQRKLIAVDRRLQVYTQLQSAFVPIPFPAMPTEEERVEDPEKATATMQEIARLAVAVPRLNEQLMAMEPALVIPARDAEGKWKPFAGAANEAFVRRIMTGESADGRLVAWSSIVDAYARGDATGFNRAVDAYLRDLASDPPAGYSPAKVWFETQMYNGFQPFMVAMVLYAVVFLMTAGSWLGWFATLRRSASAIMLVAFLVHTFALIARIYISGRPPVTSLHSSAVFIGWGCVVFGMVLESMYRLGFGNLAGSVIGFTTLVIAHLLAFGGDTFTVLQAVLDTQFWLATHVVCISLGYSTTFLAGFLAAIYIVGGVFTPVMRGEISKIMMRTTYGVLCFALFFSFVGTVLGGLWADDSWGRFWGWDPKENGALMIVLWNALILHARWGGMVRDRGLAILAVAGNIVTAWSWFGVNELGIGLHSYGFTEGVLPSLAWFAASQLTIILLGCLPLAYWWSRPQLPPAANAAGSAAAG